MSTFSIGNYNVYKRRIGKGAFSTVYKGFHKDTDKIYAIKEINLDSLSKIKESIKRETNLMRKLKHKNIIKLHDVILDKTYNNIYLILDYYKKGDLTHFLDNRPLKEMYAKKYLKQLLDGLKYLLDNNIIHRDLKPQNILMTDSLDIVLTDFGFARHIDMDNDVMIQTLCGTPMYMAPEIMKYKKYDIKSDLWSVGVILFQMLFARPPFDAKNFIDLIKNIESKEIKIPPEFDISNNCKDVLKGLLQKEPSKRMSWEELFNHDWFKKDEIMDMENKLIDIPIGKSLPDLGSFELNKQHFCSFKHKSIVDNSMNSMNSQDNKNNESNKSNNSNESNDSNTCFHMELSEELNNKMPTESYINRELDNIIKEELKKDKQETESESDNESEEDEKELFKSAKSDELLKNMYSLHNQNKIPKTEPINISYPKNYVKNEDGSNSVNKSNIFLSRSEFVLVKDNDYNSMSDPTSNNMNQTSSSFKNMLYSSFNFIKQSYNYISNNARSF